MNLFANSVTLRGFLGRDAEAPPSDGITAESFAVLTLCTEAGQWVKRDSYWLSHTAEHTIICPGPFLCGLTRGMKRGDYIEIEGTLRDFEYPQPVVISEDPLAMKESGFEIHAIKIQRLDYPPSEVYEVADN
ncbi:hypothetical protein RBB79_17250 [Tunturiibacter empetritectus]|uniref:Single-stranded DNA-binding protein n=2 Tax=Tunturiibacter TaxID=3154218 RepID=A0A852VEV6_9BACT|nr:hypothetical protein [Edaphobacter lichenicola]NYF91373.1 hypothetical protein [Edaphobacter lichenicola]